jgi:thioredoxin reductase
MRVLVECLEASRAGAGPELAVGMRLCSDETITGGLGEIPGGYGKEEAKEIVRRVVSLGLIDFVDLDPIVEPNHDHFSMPNYFIPELAFEDYVVGFREVSGSAALMAALGRVTRVADAERVIAAGTVDMVGAARGLIAEPELIKNAREGHDDRNRICIACNWCIAARRGSGGVFYCTINPATGKERQWGVQTFTPASLRSKVVVVGGGPGGMEAARVAAMRGHDVVLLEQRQALGGQLASWGSLPGREIILSTIGWYRARLSELNVEVRTGVRATAATVGEEHPDAVIVATGSRYDRTGATGFRNVPIPGWEGDLVFSPEQIIEDGARPTGNVVILDEEGLSAAPGIAEMLTAAGAKVHIVTRWQRPFEHLIATTESDFIIPHLKHLGVKVSTETYIKTIGDHQVTTFDVYTKEESVNSDVDAVVLVTMRVPVDGLARELDGKMPQLFAIGDALAPRGLAEATSEGQRFARMIGEPDAPRTFAEAYWRPVNASRPEKPQPRQ